jgi:hypothetical protein
MRPTTPKSSEIENKEEKPEETSGQDAPAENDEPQAPEINLDEILEMVKESERRRSESVRTSQT